MGEAVGGVTNDPAESTSSSKELDAPPPGDGVCTVTARVPAEEMADAGTGAVSCDPLTSVVVREDLPRNIVDPGSKPEPLTVMVKAEPPMSATAGEMLEIAGAGFTTARATLAVAVV